MKILEATPEGEYKKDPNIKAEDIAQLKTWLQKQPHLPKEVTDMNLIQFYHSSGYSLNAAKELIDVHYAFRCTAPEMYPSPNYEPPRLKQNMLDVCYMLICPEVTTPEGYRIAYCGMNDTDASHYNFEVSLATFVKMMTNTVLEQGSCPGYVFIFDLQGLTVGHLATVTISLVRKFLYFVQEGVPIRVKAIHVINITPLIDKIMFLIKPFIKKALFDIIYFYADVNELNKVVPKRCLPADLGGPLPTRLQLTELTRRKLDENSEFLIEEMSIKSDESKRIGGARMDMMQGSFKKLDLD